MREETQLWQLVAVGAGGGVLAGGVRWGRRGVLVGLAGGCVLGLIAAVAPDPADGGWIAENASRYVVAATISAARHTGGLRGAPVPSRHYYGPRAECEFRVQVVDAGWLGHLEVGVCWDTTAYPYEVG
jgi:hypothetical protein